MRKEYESNIKIIPNYYKNNAGVELLKYFKEAFSYHSILSSRESCIVNLYIFYRAQDFPELLLCIWIATETFGNKLLYLFISWVSNWELMNVFTCHKCLLSPWQIKEHFHTLCLTSDEYLQSKSVFSNCVWNCFIRLEIRPPYIQL